MHAGQKIKVGNVEVCLFPMDYVYCTQISGPNTYSHCCGHACDWIGRNNNYPIYAPFSCHKTWGTTAAYGNGRIYTSNARVITPSGLRYVSIYINHDDIPPSKTSFEQGEVIAHTGSTGQVTGDHTHIDQTLKQVDTLVQSGIYCQAGNLCWQLSESAQPYDVFYLSGSEEVVKTLGMDFLIWKGGSLKKKLWMYKRALYRKRGIIR